MADINFSLPMIIGGRSALDYRHHNLLGGH
jgi:hypothetical protein